jgi:hypothetical protein
MAGAQSGPRFSHQHYNPGPARSNLAKSLIAETFLWPYLRIDSLDVGSVRAFMLSDFDRDHFLLPPGAAALARELERFVRGHVGPVFEG